jgi:hypothetical protein
MVELVRVIHKPIVTGSCRKSVIIYIYKRGLTVYVTKGCEG